MATQYNPGFTDAEAVNNSPRESHRNRIKGLDFISSSVDCIYSVF